jgi:hypothetical protein
MECERISQVGEAMMVFGSATGGVVAVRVGKSPTGTVITGPPAELRLYATSTVTLNTWPIW